MPKASNSRITLHVNYTKVLISSEVKVRNLSIQCPPGTFSYRIVAGDTLYSLAQRYGTTVAAIIAVNPGINPNALFIGQIICIPRGTQPGTCPAGTTSYTIKAGDTLFALAQRFGTTVTAILAANPGINPNALFIGQVICIPVPPPTTRECAIVLSLSREASVAFTRPAGGTVLIQPAEQGNFAYTFVARGLPDPATLGDFGAYAGTIVIGGQVYLIVLGLAQAFEQEPTWSGTRILTGNPFTTPNNAVTIVPFNNRTGARGNPIMGGTIAGCRA